MTRLVRFLYHRYEPLLRCAWAWILVFAIGVPIAMYQIMMWLVWLKYMGMTIAENQGAWVR